MRSVSFLELFKLELDSLERLLQDFPDALPVYYSSSSEEKVHDLRTTIRRLRAAYAIIPKSERKRNMELEAFLKTCVSAFRTSSPLRDLDIVNAKMVQNSSDEDRGNVRLLEQRRIREFGRTLKKIQVLKSLAEPELALKISDKETSKRFKNRVKRLSKDSRALLCSALSDESNSEELHALRKCYKKLRYTLELQEAASGKKIKLIKTLKKRQNVLGGIHDSDVVLAYLERNFVEGSDGNSRKFLKSESRTRHKNYLGFVKLCKNSEI